MATNFDPKYHHTAFVNLHKVRTAAADKTPHTAKAHVKTESFVSLLNTSANTYTDAPKQTQVAKDVAQPSTPQIGGMWRKA